MERSLAKPVYSLIYRSFARPLWISQAALQHIADSAAQFNVQHNVTGMLIYSDGVFVQVLEGSTVDILSLSSRIAADSRNDGLRVLWHGNVPSRRFQDWAMGCFEFSPNEQGEAPLDGAILSGSEDIPAWTPEMTQRLIDFYAANQVSGLRPMFSQMRALR